MPNSHDGTGPAVTPNGTLRTRPETVADVEFSPALHDSVKAASFAQMPVSDSVRRQLLDMRFRAMTTSYRSAFPAGRFEAVTLDEVPVGRLITDSGEGRFHIVYVALLPE